MTRIIRAELFRLLRRRTLVAGVAASAFFAAVAALAVFSTARKSGTPSLRGATTALALAAAGGGTEAFAIGASFAGFLIFVTFIALMAGEFSGGTFRALLLRDPRRRRVIVGKLIGMMAVAAGMVAVAEVLTFGTSLLLAAVNDVSTTAWFSAAGMTAALADYATVLAGVAGWAVFGTMLGLVFRSAPLALGVGFAWAGPFENIVSDSWSSAYRYFPGLVLRSVVQGGTAELAMARAVLTTGVYAGLAVAVTMWLVSRRDVTA